MPHTKKARIDNEYPPGFYRLFANHLLLINKLYFKMKKDTMILHRVLSLNYEMERDYFPSLAWDSDTTASAVASNSEKEKAEPSPLLRWSRYSMLPFAPEIGEKVSP